MRNNENQLAVNMLTQINAVNPRRFQEMKSFFTDAFILQTSFPLFNEEYYREQWALYIEVLGDLAKVFENTQPEKAQRLLQQAISALQGKEVTHV